ncbi:MAG: hypothetical protein R2788_14450 [Saprospiraceae bacterium]
MDKLITEENVDVRQYSVDVLSQLKSYTKEVIEEIVNSDPFSKKVYENYLDFRKKAAVWARSSEKIFYDELMS